MSYRSTVARQPQSLADTLDAGYAELAALDLAGLSSGTVVVTGIGASFAAAVVVAAELRRVGRRAFALRPSEIEVNSNVAEVVIALSHRGRSVETVQAVENLPDATSIAITNNPDSPLAQTATYHLRLNNGSDATPSSTGYTATLLAAGLVIDAIRGESAADWGDLPGIVEEVQAGSVSKMERLRELFKERRAIDCVGMGAATGTADEASLLLREAVRLPASGYETRHYLHGPMEAMDSATGVVVFGDGREITLAKNLEEIGCPTLLVTADKSVTEGHNLTIINVPASDSLVQRAIIDILPAQLLAAELSDAAGLTDVKFRYHQTDTKLS